jgi:DNA mismatch endonuclease (patch repair protein)
MSDNRTKEQRSYNMRQIKSKNTSLEIFVRRELHLLGYRFRIHNNQLPGRPDIVLAKYKTIIFINGCFWHRCSKCNPKIPKSNFVFWQKKFESNIKRDNLNRMKLEELNWKVVTLWECDLKNNPEDSFSRLITQVEKNRIYLY